MLQGAYNVICMLISTLKIVSFVQFGMYSKINMMLIFMLHRHYKRVYQEFFMMSDGDNEKETAFSTTTSHVSDYHRFGWFLFLALRKHAFSRFKDIVTCTNGLVSILVSY